MASIQQLKAAAAEAGFVPVTCVHKSAGHHLVFDYPVEFKNGQNGPHWRVHTDLAKVPRATHIIGTDTDSQRVSLKNAIDFMQRVARQNPK
jgi:hypothetical protein